MFAVKGVFRNGVAEPVGPVAGREGLPVVITFLEEPQSASETEDDDLHRDLSSEDLEVSWNAFERLVEECKVDTGIGDLAHEHDHYLYGTPKKGYRPPQKD